MNNITYRVKDESRVQRRLITRTDKHIPCFRVYRENDGACIASYGSVEEAAAEKDRLTRETKNIGFDAMRREWAENDQ